MLDLGAGWLLIYFGIGCIITTAVYIHDRVTDSSSVGIDGYSQIIFLWGLPVAVLIMFGPFMLIGWLAKLGLDLCIDKITEKVRVHLDNKNKDWFK